MLAVTVKMLKQMYKTNAQILNIERSKHRNKT